MLKYLQILYVLSTQFYNQFGADRPYRKKRCIRKMWTKHVRNFLLTEYFLAAKIKVQCNVCSIKGIYKNFIRFDGENQIFYLYDKNIRKWTIGNGPIAYIYLNVCNKFSSRFSVHQKCYLFIVECLQRRLQIYNNINCEKCSRNRRRGYKVSHNVGLFMAKVSTK